MPYLVNNAEYLLGLMTSLPFVGRAISDTMLRMTFFEHFCGGENVDELRTVVERLRGGGNRVRAILDYAVEDAYDEDDVDDDVGGVERDDDDDRVTGGVEYDRRKSAYASCVRIACDVTSNAAAGDDDAEGGGGYAAIKVTALCDPITLERVSNAINAARDLYANVFDAHGTGSITREEFARRYELSFICIFPPKEGRWEEVDVLRYSYFLCTHLLPIPSSLNETLNALSQN